MPAPLLRSAVTCILAFALLPLGRADEAGPGGPGVSWKLPPCHLTGQDYYPPPAQRREIWGYVILEFAIDSHGTASATHIVKAAPRGIFEAAGMKFAQHLACQVPQDWAARGGDTHPFRFGVYFRLCEKNVCRATAVDPTLDDSVTVEAAF